jgi:hypothetical protein
VCACMGQRARGEGGGGATSGWMGEESEERILISSFSLCKERERRRERGEGGAGGRKGGRDEGREG